MTVAGSATPIWVVLLVSTVNVSTAPGVVATYPSFGTCGLRPLGFTDQAVGFFADGAATYPSYRQCQGARASGLGVSAAVGLPRAIGFSSWG